VTCRNRRPVQPLRKRRGGKGRLHGHSRRIRPCTSHSLLPPDPAATSSPFGPLHTARDALLALDPLSKPHVVAVNKAEAQFWQRSHGVKVDWADRILGFECGGETQRQPRARPAAKMGTTSYQGDVKERGGPPAPGRGFRSVAAEWRGAGRVWVGGKGKAAWERGHDELKDSCSPASRWGLDGG
jgi:hypothetical protein